MLGGRTNHWGRISLRFGPDDFRRKSLDGLGDDWPITYDDLKPYYDSVDRYIGIFGSNEGLPNDPDGIFQPPPKPRCYELLIKQASERLNITCIPIRLSILTQPLNDRPACHYCGQCGRGCASHANFSSPSVLLPPALATKRLTHRHQRDGARGHGRRRRAWPTGVTYIDKNTGRENHVRGRDRGDGGERVRDRAAAAQLEVVAVSARPRQLERRRRQVPHRHDRHQRARLHPEDDEQRAAQRRRRQRIASLHAVVGRQQEARFPARLSHRARRRPAHARLRHARRHAALHGTRATAAWCRRRLRQAAEGRLPPLLRRDGGLLRAAAR